jgi:hypothetical protein
MIEFDAMRCIDGQPCDVASGRTIESADSHCHFAPPGLEAPLDAGAAS